MVTYLSTIHSFLYILISLNLKIWLKVSNQGQQHLWDSTHYFDLFVDICLLVMFFRLQFLSNISANCRSKALTLLRSRLMLFLILVLTFCIYLIRQSNYFVDFHLDNMLLLIKNFVRFTLLWCWRIKVGKVFLCNRHNRGQIENNTNLCFDDVFILFVTAPFFVSKLAK